MLVACGFRLPYGRLACRPQPHPCPGRWPRPASSYPGPRPAPDRLPGAVIGAVAAAAGNRSYRRSPDGTGWVAGLAACRQQVGSRSTRPPARPIASASRPTRAPSAFYDVPTPGDLRVGDRVRSRKWRHLSLMNQETFMNKTSARLMALTSSVALAAGLAACAALLSVRPQQLSGVAARRQALTQCVSTPAAQQVGWWSMAA